MIERPRIIDVVRKPSKCPKCGERVVDIIYGTGDMTESEFLLEYRREGIMGGDNIPRRPPIWACSCGCKRFRKVNPDGTDAPVKVKMLKDIKPAPLTKIIWESEQIEDALTSGSKDIHDYTVDIVTEKGESDTLKVAATSEEDAMQTAINIVSGGRVGLEGRFFKSIKVTEDNE